MKTINELTKLASAHFGTQLPDETHMAHPTPTSGPGQKALTLGFMFSTSLVRPKVGVLLLPPYRVGHIDALNGVAKDLVPVTPEIFGLHDDPTKFLGGFKLPEGMSGEQYTAKRARLNQLFDELLPAYAAGDHKHRGDSTEFKAIFEEIAEPMLLPYYHSLGRPFFGWLEDTKE